MTEEPKLPATVGCPKGVTDKMRDARSAELKVKVWEDYKNGLTSYKDISKKYEGQVSAPTVGVWIRAELKLLAKERHDLAEDFLEAELQRLDKLLEICMEDVTTSIQLSVAYSGTRKTPSLETTLIDRVDTQVVTAILKIMDRRSKYLALDKGDEKEKNEFDLAELINAAMVLKKGGIPEEFKDAIDAEFKTVDKKGEVKDGKE